MSAQDGIPSSCAGAVKDTLENVPSHLRQINSVLSFPIRIGPGLIIIIGLG